MPLYIETVAAATETATKILARRAGKTWNVSTTCNGGGTANVSWSFPDVTLNLPSLPPDTLMTRTEADRLVAYIAHECCHVLHTDWRAWQAAVAAGARVKHWTNALEDVRIEAREIRAGAFPALRGLLSGLCTQTHFDAITKAGAGGCVIGQGVSDAPYVACILGRLRNRYEIPTAAPLAGKLSAGVRQLVDLALAELPGCKDTWAVYALARRLAAMETAMTPPPPPQDGPGEPQGGADGQDGPGEPQGGADGQDGPGEPQRGVDGQDGPGEPQRGVDGQGTPADGPGQDINPAPDLSEMVKAIAQRAGLESLATDRSHILNTSRAWIERDTRDAKDYASYNHPATANLNARMPANSLLHGQVSRLLVSDEVNRRTHHETSGRLDRRAIVRMRTGASDVFSRRDDTPGVNTALLVLVDGSGSMCADVENANGVSTGQARMHMAQCAAWHIARAAEAANAKVAVACFYTPSDAARRAMHGADIYIVKDWETGTQDAAYAMTRMNGRSTTPLSQSIIGAAEYLASVTGATRRILLVVTDGGCDLGPASVAAACNIAAHMRVEAVGLGMACPEVVDAFPVGYSENITDLTHLATKGMAVLTRMLEDANPRGAD